jgi:hypothetical protein
LRSLPNWPDSGRPGRTQYRRAPVLCGGRRLSSWRRRRPSCPRI